MEGNEVVTLLADMLQELRGIRQEQYETKQKIDSLRDATRDGIKLLYIEQQRTNQRLDDLARLASTDRILALERRMNEWESQHKTAH